MNNRLISVIILVLAGVSIPMMFPATFYNALELQKISAQQTGNLLAQLVFYALIIERITEIFIESSFTNQKTGIKATYVYEEESYERAAKAFQKVTLLEVGVEKYNSMEKSLSAAKENLETKKSNAKANERWLELTGKIKLAAILFSISLGVLLALVGVRILGTLVPPLEFGAPDKDIPFQTSLRTGVDVMITGLLLAGGAAGLHPIINHLKKFGHKEKG